MWRCELAGKTGGPDEEPVLVEPRQFGGVARTVQDLVAHITPEEVVQTGARAAVHVQATLLVDAALLRKRWRNQRDLTAKRLQCTADQTANRPAQRGIDLHENPVLRNQVCDRAHGLERFGIGALAHVEVDRENIDIWAPRTRSPCRDFGCACRAERRGGVARPGEVVGQNQ